MAWLLASWSAWRTGRSSSATAGWVRSSPPPCHGCAAPRRRTSGAPEAVVSLHVSFINAGADLIETNSFGANRRKLAAHFLEDELENINSTAVKLARQARETTGRDVFVAGSIGPLGQAATSRVRRELFAEQAGVLEGRGADLFMVETFYDLEEVVDAVEAVRSVSSLPIVALMTFDEGAETLAGDHRRRGGRAARRSSTSPRSAPTTAPACSPRSPRSTRWARRPAARRAAEHRPGEPRRRPRHLPARLARVLRRVRRARARPRRADHRRLLRHDPGGDRRDPDRGRGGAAGARAARARRARAGRRPRRGAARDRPGPRAARGRVGRLGAARPAARRLQPRARSRSPLRSRSRARSASSTSTTTPRARAGMSALMVSAAIERECGIETVPHLTTRDWTVMGLESMLLGAHAEGVRNILAITGDPPEVGDYPGSRGVYEVDAIGLTRADGPDEPRRGLQRPADRRAHLVLHRRRRQPDSRRPGARARPLPPEGRRRRPLRDDADRLRPRPPRPLPRAAGRRVADPACWSASSR